MRTNNNLSNGEQGFILPESNEGWRARRPPHQASASLTGRGDARSIDKLPRKVALILRPDSGSVQEIMQGVAAFAQLHRKWSFRRMFPEMFDLQVLHSWGPDGIIVHTERKLQLAKLGVPVVTAANLLGDKSSHDLVHVDDALVGKLAAEYFCEAGFTSLGFVGTHGFCFSRDRQEAFTEEIHSRGAKVTSLELPPSGPWERYVGVEQYDSWQIDGWLEQLSRPAAIFAANDELSLPVSEACHRMGLRIPEDIALLGVDNDHLLCELSSPPLSSIMVPAKRVGYEAAALLGQRMNGQLKGPPVKRLLEPVGIKVRQSSDILALEDQDLAAAVRFIRDHANEPITVGDILRNVPISRRVMEKRFRKLLSRSPLDELHRVRVERAKQILSSTDLSMPQVASQSGLGDNKQMCAIFRKLVGKTPTQWRNQSRVREMYDR